MIHITEEEHRLVEMRIAGLETEHRDIDSMLNHLESTGFPDQIALRRMKKRKLQLKDEITRLQMSLVPDILA
jgi:hypothetical protein